MGFRVNHLHLKTPDPRKTADFYVEFAGAKIVSERAGPDGRKIFRLDLHGVPLNITDYLSDQKLEQHYGLEHVAIDAENGTIRHKPELQPDAPEVITRDWLPPGHLSLGLTAGASTPNNKIGETIERVLATRRNSLSTA